MLSVDELLVLGDDLAAELGLTAIQLAHVGARVRRLQPRHAVRAAQLDDHHVGALGLAAQRLEEGRPAARAHGHRGHGGEPIDRPGRIRVPHVSSGRLPGSRRKHGQHESHARPGPARQPRRGPRRRAHRLHHRRRQDVPGLPHRAAVAAPPRRRQTPSEKTWPGQPRTVEGAAAGKALALVPGDERRRARPSSPRAGAPMPAARVSSIARRTSAPPMSWPACARERDERLDVALGLGGGGDPLGVRAEHERADDASPSCSAIRRPPPAAHSVAAATRASIAENGSLPHWPVCPRSTSHSTASSNRASTAAASAGPPSRIVKSASRGGIRSCSSRDELARVLDDEVGAELERGSGSSPPSRTARRRRCTAAG